MPLNKPPTNILAKTRDVFSRSSHCIHPDWLIQYSLPKGADINLLSQRIKGPDSNFSASELENLSDQLESTLHLIEGSYLRDENQRNPIVSLKMKKQE
jgi:hypothetical protein